MKKRFYYAVIFLCLPAAMLITVVIRRGTGYQGTPAIVWFQEMKMEGPSPGLDALKKLGTRAVPTLQEALMSPQRYQRFRAAWALEQLGPVASNAVPDLIRALDDSDVGVRIYSMQALAAIGTTREDLVQKIVRRLANTRECNYAAALLNRIEQERKARNLPPVFTDEYEYAMAFAHAPVPAVRLNALPRLRQKDERSMAAYKALLNDTNGWVREQTAIYLKNQGIMVTNQIISARTSDSIQVTPQK